jgi:ABC-2 type transport system permease protein
MVGRPEPTDRPVAPGVEAIQDIVLSSEPSWLTHRVGPGGLFIQPLVIVAVGIVLFGRLELLAKRRDTLGRY